MVSPQAQIPLVKCPSQPKPSKNMGKAELKTKLTAEISELGSQIAAAKKDGKPKDEVSG
jgi:hypothetical protein